MQKGLLYPLYLLNLRYKTSVMHIIIKIPSIVEKYAPYFEDIFSTEGYAYFQKYLSGLYLSENKTVEAINRLFVTLPRNQSSFNRFLNCQNFSLSDLSQRSIGLMQQNSSTAFKVAVGNSGVLSLDDTLLSHYGKHMEHICSLWDHVYNHYTLAHNLVSLHYSDDATDYPLYHIFWEAADWEAVAIKMKELNIHVNEQKWEKRHEAVKDWRNYMHDRYKDYQYKRPELQEVYKTKVLLGLNLLRRFKQNYPTINLPVAMDSGYTSAEICKTIDKELKMTYVGALTSTQIIILENAERLSLAQFKDRLIVQHLDKNTPKCLKFFKTTIHYKKVTKSYFAYCGTHRINGYENKQRLVIAFENEDFSDFPWFTVSNRLHWQASGILRIRRHRWPIETFHQESKAEGLDKYQLRHFRAITTHVAFVSVAYTMLKRAIHDDELMSVFRQRMLEKDSDGTLPFLRSCLKVEELAALVELVFLNTKNGKTLQQINQQLIDPLYP
jgi:hypothetical protein